MQSNELEKYYLNLKEKYDIKNEQLDEILKYITDHRIFFDDTEEALLYDKEVINYKDELDIEADIIPIIDMNDNDYIVFDLISKKFQKFYIVEEMFWADANIQEYIDRLKEITSL